MDKRQVGQTGLFIDTLGLGGAPLGGNYVDLDYAQAAELITTAKAAGLRGLLVVGQSWALAAPGCGG